MHSFRTEIENPIVEKDILDLAKKIAQFKAGEIHEEKFRSLRLARGVYGQRQQGVQAHHSHIQAQQQQGPTRLRMGCQQQTHCRSDHHSRQEAAQLAPLNLARVEPTVKPRSRDIHQQGQGHHFGQGPIHGQQRHDHQGRTKACQTQYGVA